MLLLCLFGATSATVTVRPPRTTQTPAEWHRERRRQILDAHPEVKSLMSRATRPGPVCSDA